MSIDTSKASIMQHTTGTYTEPFDSKEFGAFVEKADGTIHFVATGYSHDHARQKAEDYYQAMADHPQNKMDMTDLDRMTFKVRTVTRSPWDDYAV